MGADRVPECSSHATDGDRSRDLARSRAHAPTRESPFSVISVIASTDESDMRNVSRYRLSLGLTLVENALFSLLNFLVFPK
jgi:hypothetical protein